MDRELEKEREKRRIRLFSLSFCCTAAPYNSPYGILVFVFCSRFAFQQPEDDLAHAALVVGGGDLIGHGLQSLVPSPKATVPS